MIVELGREIVGTNGKLGQVAGFSMDPNSQAADQLVIKHGALRGDERLAVLGYVTGVETGLVRVNLSRDDLARLEKYNPDAYRSVEPDFGGPSMFDWPDDPRFHRGPGKELQAAPSEDPTEPPREKTHPMPPQYPANQDIAPEDERLTVISRGAPVWDTRGRKIGHVQEFAVETTTGEPTRIAIQRGGILGGSLVELPLEWVERFTPKGMTLNVNEEQVKGIRPQP